MTGVGRSTIRDVAVRAGVSASDRVAGAGRMDAPVSADTRDRVQRRANDLTPAQARADQTLT